MFTPKKNSNIIKIPITFDANYTRRGFKPVILYLIALIWFLALVISIFLCSSEFTIIEKLLSIGVLAVIAYVVSFVILVNEKYFRTARRELLKNNFSFDTSCVWNVYDFADSAVPVMIFPNNVKAVAVEVIKGSIVGNLPEHEYNHYEVIKDIYKDLRFSGYTWTHLDYMDLVGRDTRMDGVVKDYSTTENADLRRLLLQVADNVHRDMDSAFATYEVYVIYKAGVVEDILKELSNILPRFRQAGYVQYRYLNRKGIRRVVTSLYKLTDFSTKTASEVSSSRRASSLTTLIPIWVEKDGVKTQLNKSVEEMEAEKAILLHEKKAKKNNKRVAKQLKKMQKNVTVYDTKTDTVQKSDDDIL